jgi:hypothetical protein
MMTYRIQGLAADGFAPFFGLGREELEAHDMRRVISDSSAGFPCRISLEDALEGASLLLLNYVSHDVSNPFRTAFAIFVREGDGEPPTYDDSIPPILAGRTLSLRGFDDEGMLRAASLAMPGEADRAVRDLFAKPEIAGIHAHNAAHGCFLARVERN